MVVKNGIEAGEESAIGGKRWMGREPAKEMGSLLEAVEKRETP
jgi:hypothetical protein